MKSPDAKHDHKHMKLDRLGIALSGLCLVHCLGTPFLILLFPTISQLGGYDSWLHGTLAVLLIPVALIAVTQGYLHHRKKIVALLAGAGAVLIGFGAFLPEILPHMSHSHGSMSDSLKLTVMGSLFLAVCHFLNMHYCRKHKITKPCHGHHSIAPNS